MMSGLGIDFDPPLDYSASKDAENVLPQNATLKSSRRRAHVRGRSHLGKGDNTSKAHTQAQIPSMPLRENHSMVNASLQPSPVYMMKHPLPAKPMVDWSVMQDVQPVPARLRVETPSDTSTSPQSMLVPNPVSLNVPQPVPVPMFTSSSSPYLHVEDQCSTPLTPLQKSLNDMAIHELPAKPQSTPMLPPERDERVGIDVFMENDLCVEGSTLHGYIRLVLPNHTDPSTAMLLAQPRVRLIGFETLPDEDIRHIFYRHMSVIDGDRSNDGPSEPYVLHGSPAMSQADGAGQSLLPCFASLPDNDGYYLGQAGEHVLPFSLQVPMDKGAKGSYQSSSAEVGYIIIASVRVKAFGDKQGGVAHCFQKLQLYPYLNPTAVLASASRPIVAHANSAEADARCIQLAASLHRETWVAGQRVYFDVSVLNNGENMLNMLRIALVRVENVYYTRSTIPASPLDLNSSSSIIVDDTLTAGNSQHWWTGAPSGSPVYFAHSFQLPDNIISMERSRHVEVQYMLRIGVGADASTLVEVDLPLQVINYVSLDPPPPRRTYMNAAGLLGHSSHSLPDQQQMIERLRTLDAMRSPRDKHNSSLLTPDSAQPVAVRTAQHKRSLDFINSAIRSATARHTSPFVTSSMTPAGLGIELGPNASASITSTPVRALPTQAFCSSVPVVQVRGPVDSVADTSLTLGDETVGDVELFFDKDKNKADNSNVSTHVACHETLDSYGEPSWTMKNEREANVSQSNSNTAPSTPVRDTKSRMNRGSASVPRALRAKSSFTFATSTSPLKVKATDRTTIGSSEKLRSNSSISDKLPSLNKGTRQAL